MNKPFTISISRRGTIGAAILLLWLGMACGRNAEPKPNVLKDWSGGWIRTEYLQQILNKTTPYQAFPSCKGISGLIIPENGDSVMIVFNFWEGDHYPIQSIQDSVMTLTLKHPKPSDPKSVRVILSGDRRSIRFEASDSLSFQFSKYPPSFNARLMPQELVHKLFFTGIYQIIGTQDTVEFMTNGSLRGLKGYDQYRVLIAFMENFRDDCLQLRQEGNNQGKWMTWELRQDTLMVYETYATSQSPAVRAGLAWQLLKLR